MLAFISYQTKDKKIAGQIKEILKKEGIESFLAHEDIAVSEEWRLEILKQIKKAKIFIAVITKNYLESIWCIQEAGIAAAKPTMTAICLLLDDSTPPGFLQAVQGKRCHDGEVKLSDLLPGLVKSAPELIFGKMIDEISRAGSYRWAEQVYEEIMPYIRKLSPAQARRLLEVGYKNDQVRHAALCVKQYIPKVLSMHRKHIDDGLYQKIVEVLDSYNKV